MGEQTRFKSTVAIAAGGVSLARGRTFCLALFVFSLAGCFVFDNPYENATPTAQFQIVVHGGPCPGTYMWNPADTAYEAVVSGQRCKVYMDSSGKWWTYSGATMIADTYTPYFRALPPTSGWSVSMISIDDSAAGISAQGALPDTVIAHTQTLQVAFLPSEPGDTATYQWVKSDAQSGSPSTPLGTGPTYALTSSEVGKWIRVIIDSTGKIQGTPVTSPPVNIPN